MVLFVPKDDLDASPVGGRSIVMPHWLDDEGMPRKPTVSHPPDIVENPTVQMMSRHGYLPINDPDPPAHDKATQKADPQPRKEVNGEAQRQWRIVAKTAKERSDYSAEQAELARQAYRTARKADYVAELGQDSSFENTVGDVLDAVIKEIRAMQSNPTTPEFAALVAQIDVIKARHPRS